MTEQLKQKSTSEDSIVTSSFINRGIRCPEASLELFALVEQHYSRESISTIVGIFHSLASTIVKLSPSISFLF